MLSYLIVVAALFVVLARPAVAAEPRVVERWAVLVGVDDYAYAQKLKYCGADQRALHRQLLASGFPEDHVFLLHDEAENPRFRPSQRNIERQLDLVLNLADAEDLVIIAFSGHGVHLDGKSYLCPGDCTLDDAATLIGVDRIYDRLKECAAGFKLVLVDACRNDPRPGGGRSMTATEGTRALARTLQELKLPEGVVLLNSCAPGEVSWEDEKFGHGVFMHYVLDGLRGSADTGGDGSVSLHELQAYAGTRTKTFVANKYAVAQRPFFKGDLTTEALEYALLPVPRGSNLPPPTDAPPPAVAPFDAVTARGHQEAWAKHLSQDAEYVNAGGMKFRLIPPGEFLMGADEDALSVLRRFNYLEPLHIADDYPLHKVRITRPYYLGIHEVTLGQFLEFYHDAKYKVDCERDGLGGYGWTGTWEQRRTFVPWDWGFHGQTMDHPVVNISWNDATAFCEWLSRKEGRTYRLPTEAEWEFACKAGTTTRYWFGNDPEEGVRFGNMADQADRRLAPRATLGDSDRPFPFLEGDDGETYTARVGRYPPNPFGLHDMHGNVQEWCRDVDGPYPAEAVDDPQGAAAGEYYIYRGGGWDSTPPIARSGHRSGGKAAYRFATIGFRVVLEP
jgi:formylglycine-generating enzyme required for sulfatase activity